MTIEIEAGASFLQCSMKSCSEQHFARSFVDPFMIHEAIPTLTETASGSHPCCVVSVTYARAQCFHGGNTGSNPVGDANFSNLTGSLILHITASRC